MSRRGVILFVALALAVIVAIIWWRESSREGQIRYYRHAMWKAHERAFSVAKATRGPFFWDSHWLDQLRGRPTTTAHYLAVAKENERALFDLGYFTNIDLSLGTTNITRAFRSNFVWQLRQRFGTNENHAWIMYPMPDGTGFRPALPRYDVAEWQRIFRECAARYASNTVAPAIDGVNK